MLRAARSIGARTVPVTPDGVIDLGALAEALHPGVTLVSVMSANNEVGTIQPLGEVVDLVRARAPRAAVHTDAVAAVGHVDVAAQVAGADLVSVSAHKFGGPKGVGALVSRSGTPLAAVLHGGGQERDRRPGTHDVAGIVGMAAALVGATARRQEDGARLRRLRDRLACGLCASVPDTAENAPGAAGAGTSVDRLPHVANLRFTGVESEELLLLLDEEGIFASAGAACASGAAEPSHVLLAMRLSPEAGARRPSDSRSGTRAPTLTSIVRWPSSRRRSSDFGGRGQLPRLLLDA